MPLLNLSRSGLLFRLHAFVSHAYRVDWGPFAGLKQSGVGGIPYSFKDMQIDKMMMLRSSAL